MQAKTAIKQLLVEKYRPNNLEDYVFPTEQMKKDFVRFAKEKQIPNVFLFGVQGTGKSTLAKIMQNELEVDPSDLLYIKATTMSGIAYIRETLDPWARRQPVGRMKLVWIEEADSLSKDAQKALRILTEDYSDTVRFIMTANYPASIIPALISRFTTYELSSTTDNDAIAERLLTVLVTEGVDVDLDDSAFVGWLLGLVDAHTPDIRKMINIIDASLHTEDDGTKTINYDAYSANTNADDAQWFDYINSVETFTTATMRDLIPLASAVDMNNFASFYDALVDNSSKFGHHEPAAIMNLSLFLTRAYSCANQRLHLSAFCYTMISEMEA
jgi:replication factor C small subunit